MEQAEKTCSHNYVRVNTKSWTQNDGGRIRHIHIEYFTCTKCAVDKTIRRDSWEEEVQSGAGYFSGQSCRTLL